MNFVLEHQGAMHELTCSQYANESVKMMAWYTKPEHDVAAICRWPLWTCLSDDKSSLQQQPA